VIGRPGSLRVRRAPPQLPSANTSQPNGSGVREEFQRAKDRPLASPAGTVPSGLNTGLNLAKALRLVSGHALSSSSIVSGPLRDGSVAGTIS
jgi:hypothetical protein